MLPARRRRMDTATAGRGEWMALGALLLPWGVLSLLLPLGHLVVAFSLLLSLAMLLGAAVGWSRRRAADLKLDAEAWGLAAVLSLGFSMALLLGGPGRSGYDAMCDDCGHVQDMREQFCYRCGAY